MSQDLKYEQVLDTIKFISAANMIEIHTDDFLTYSNKEASVQVKVFPET